MIQVWALQALNYLTINILNELHFPNRDCVQLKHYSLPVLPSFSTILPSQSLLNLYFLPQPHSSARTKTAHFDSQSQYPGVTLRPNYAEASAQEEKVLSEGIFLVILERLRLDLRMENPKQRP